jgi:hypothetical protein
VFAPESAIAVLDANGDSLVTPIHGVESGGKDDNFQLVNLAIGSLQTFLFHGSNGVLLDIDRKDMNSIELVIISSIAGRTASVHIMGSEYGGFRWILDYMAYLSSFEIA